MTRGNGLEATTITVTGRITPADLGLHAYALVANRNTAMRRGLSTRRRSTVARKGLIRAQREPPARPLCMKRSLLALASLASLAAAAQVAAQSPRQEVVAQGLDRPWAFTFLPGGDFLVNEKPGAMRIVSAQLKADRSGRKRWTTIWARSSAWPRTAACRPTTPL